MRSVGVWRVRMVAVWRVAVWRVAVRKVAVRRVAVRRVAVEEELAAAGCAHAVRSAGGAFGVGVGGSDGGSLHEQGCAELSHCTAELEKEQNKCEHRVAG
jgi:hypothetical protein